MWKLTNKVKSHNATFSVDFANYFLKNFIKDNGSVYEPFAGTGTILIGGEIHNKKTYNLELDPIYCDVIVKRYIKFCKENNKPYSVKLNGADYKGGLLDA